MLTREQLALAPIVKTASERQAEAFGKDTMIAMERVLRGINFADCHKAGDAVQLLFGKVKKLLKARGAPVSRYAYIARRMCKTMVSEIIKAGLSGEASLEEVRREDAAEGSDDTVR